VNTQKKIIPINSERSPALVTDLIYSMKVGDVMTRKVVTATPEDSLAGIKTLMKENNVTGIPVMKGKRLLGMVSMHDIFMAIDGGHMDDKAEDRMSKKLVMLEEDMPLAFAITYFNKFRFGRFPVVDKTNQLVGVVTSRDISVGLLQAINKEVEKLEKKLEPPESPEIDGGFHKVFRIHKYDFENAGKASNAMKQLLIKKKADPKDVRRIIVAMYELEMNVTVHSEGGTIELGVDNEKAVITARDGAPGIADVSAALKKGFSTANEWIRSLGFGAGMGLYNVQRVSDEFNIESSRGAGTTARAVILFGKGDERKGDEGQRS
jgi:CBS domain-containing protein/anti-sigma regulatory factor (Ser/Thr protein kinase)